LGTRPEGEGYGGTFPASRQTLVNCLSHGGVPMAWAAGYHFVMSQGAVASPEVQNVPKPMTKGPMGPWAVVVHNDDINTFDFVIRCLREIARLDSSIAIAKTMEIHQEGASAVAHSHREHAELICERLQSRGLTATCEPA